MTETRIIISEIDFFVASFPARLPLLFPPMLLLMMEKYPSEVKRFGSLDLYTFFYIIGKYRGAQQSEEKKYIIPRYNTHNVVSFHSQQHCSLHIWFIYFPNNGIYILAEYIYADVFTRT